MILIDSSVWIDYLRHIDSPQTDALKEWEATRRLATGDLILMEVLQGTRDRRSFALTLDRMSLMEQVQISDRETAIAAAQNFQRLRALGVTVRSTIDTLIATRCILDDIPLLYSDRDFDPFVQHLGLRSALDHPGVN